MPSFVLLARTHVEHDDVTEPRPAEQFLAADVFGIVGTEVGGAGRFHVGQVGIGDGAHQRVQGGDVRAARR